MVRAIKNDIQALVEEAKSKYHGLTRCRITKCRFCQIVDRLHRDLEALLREKAVWVECPFCVDGGVDEGDKFGKCRHCNVTTDIQAVTLESLNMSEQTESEEGT